MNVLYTYSLRPVFRKYVSVRMNNQFQYKFHNSVLTTTLPIKSLQKIMIIILQNFLLPDFTKILEQIKEQSTLS